MKTGSDYLADQLFKYGVRVAFVFTGGAISAIIDAVHRRGIKIVPYDHELDASYAAEGYVRATLSPAVVLVTSGPGATNTITGIAGSWFDSIPVLFISGQVKSHEKTNFDLNLQNGFQETDVIKSTSHFTKYSKTIDNCSQIIPVVREAFKLMLSGRPGPAVLDITMDAQAELMQNPGLKKLVYLDFKESLKKGLLSNDKLSLRKDYEKFLDLIQASKKPVILIGGGLQWLEKDLVNKVINKIKAKVVSTYAGINAINFENLFYDGMIGPFGHPLANKTLIEASDLFIIGARIPQRALPILKKSSKAKLLSIKKYVLTVDPSEFINHRIGPIEKIFYGLSYNFFQYVDKKLVSSSKKNIKKIHSNIFLPKDMFVSIPSKSDSSLTIKNQHSVRKFIESLNLTLPFNANIFVDVGQNAVALALGLKRTRGEKLYSSWANSPMGYSLPASLGAALGHENRKSICIIGDGGLRTALCSLPNLRLMKGKVKIILWDNQGYRTIVDHVEKMLAGRRQGVTEQSGVPSFPLDKVLVSSGLDVLHAKKNLENDMRLFFNDKKFDVLIVSIDHSIRMVPNKFI